MKFETERNNRKILLIPVIIFVVVLTLILSTSLAKYITKENVELAKGNINYIPYDYKIMAMYQDDTEISTMPKDGYVIDTDKTYCYVDTSNNKEYNLIHTNEYGEHIFKDLDKQAKCYLYFKSSNIYTESILNGADPVLKEGLIPVMIDKDGTVTKASLYTEWYDYESKVWANAVILEDESKTYEAGEVIPETNIQSYFVWIPRYKYKIWDTGLYSSYTTLYENGSATEVVEYNPDTGKYTGNTEGNARTIEIIFENKNTTISTGSNVGEYLTHPAFTAFNTNGIWVGKFETGYKGASINNDAEEISTDESKIIVKPNVYSWRMNPVANAFLLSLNYKTNYTSHLMKNIEWGAVAYLSLSIYGKNGEVNVNNNDDYLTGYSATSNTMQNTFVDACTTSWGAAVCGRTEDITQPYNTVTGYNASTSGNISGVYDMSGGAYEYIAAYLTGYGAVDSGFSSDPAETYGQEYFDVYPYNGTINSFVYRKLGDATGELGPFYNYKDGTDNTSTHSSWYKDTSNFIFWAVPWFSRGGGMSNGSQASQLSFNRASAVGAHNCGFRIVLAI